jgi:ADP-ribose pyrophosphatase YjhB (NUDIX family)
MAMSADAAASVAIRENAMKYCCECGAAVALSRSPGKSMVCYVCIRCRRIYYHSPRLVAGCIAAIDDRILLCQRGVDPAYGLWNLPSGFIEMPECAPDGAAREALEEANVAIDLERLYALFHIPHINQTLLVYLARLQDAHVVAGPETLAARLFKEAEVPWDQLAFATTQNALQRYFEDRRNGDFGFHFAEIVPFDSWPQSMI